MRSSARRSAVFSVVCAAVLLSGCPQGSGQQDLSTLPSTTTSDRRAEAELRAAEEAAETGTSSDAEERFRGFLRDHGDDPLAPVARLGLGRVLLANMRLEEAAAEFEAASQSDDTRIAESGRFYQGVTHQLAGRSDEAIEALQPLVGQTTDPEQTELLLRTLAAAALRVNRITLALDTLDRLASAESIREDARAGAREDINRVVDEANEEAIAQAYTALSRAGAAWPAVAMRAIRIAFDAGDMERVSEMVAELRQHDLPMSDALAELAVRAERTVRADPRVIGAIVPLTGAGRAVGQSTVRGLMLAANAPLDAPPGPETPQLVLRDDGGDPARAAAAVEDLVSEHRAIAIVGPLSGPAARIAAERAQELGVPIITLAPITDVTGRGDMVFRLLAGVREEARALVQAARSRGATRFAVLHPTSGFGSSLADAFDSAVSQSGGQLVHRGSYPPSATAFGEQITPLASTNPDAVLIADGATRLTLIAPALAAAGLWSTATPGSRVRTERRITLLAPSVALAAASRDSRRYLEGTLFAAPFHTGSTTGAASSFLQAFRDRFRTSPDTFAAHAFDAFRLIRGAVQGGAATRNDVAAWLRGRHDPSTVTSSGGLAEDGSPARPAAVLVLRGGTLEPEQAPTAE